MQAGQHRWLSHVMLAVAALLAPRHTWWGQLLFWAAVFWFAFTGIYLWASRGRRTGSS